MSTNWSTSSVSSWFCVAVRSSPQWAKLYSLESLENVANTDTTGAGSTHFFLAGLCDMFVCLCAYRAVTGNS